MPPRHAYWTILIDSKPTAFRATKQEELLPTLAQLQRTNTDVVMKWFARGKIWENPEQAQWATRNVDGRADSRGRDWRPGGSHEDPRARFERKKRNPRGKPIAGHGGTSGVSRNSSGRQQIAPPQPPADRRPPPSFKKPFDTRQGRPSNKAFFSKPFGPRPHGKPHGGHPAGGGLIKPPGSRPPDKPYGDRFRSRPGGRPFSARPHDKPVGARPPGPPTGAPPHRRPFGGKPFGSQPQGSSGDRNRPWMPKARPPKGGDRPWSAKPRGPAAAGVGRKPGPATAPTPSTGKRSPASEVRPWSAKPRGPKPSDRPPFRPETRRPPKTFSPPMSNGDASQKKRDRDESGD